MGYSGARGKLFHEKTCSWKSRVRLPLSQLVCYWSQWLHAKLLTLVTGLNHATKLNSFKNVYSSIEWVKAFYCSMTAHYNNDVRVHRLFADHLEEHDGKKSSFPVHGNGTVCIVLIHGPRVFLCLWWFLDLVPAHDIDSWGWSLHMIHMYFPVMVPRCDLWPWC